jgi:hypothetical protein
MKLRDIIGSAADPLQIQVLLGSMNANGLTLDSELDNDQAFMAAVLYHISVIPWLNPHQQQYLSRAIMPYLVWQEESFEFTLAICNGQFVTWTGLQGFVDIKVGTAVATCPPVFESIAYNFQTRMNMLLEQARQGCQSPPETSG